MQSLQFIPDDCLEELTINNLRITSNILPFCDYTNGRIIDISDIIHPGTNTIHALIRNHGGPTAFAIKQDIKRLSQLGLVLSIIICVIGILFFVTTTKNVRPKWSWYTVAILASIAIRFLYYLETDIQTRGYDTDCHIEYLMYMIANWSIPAASGGWQYYQPPLYYLLLAIPGIFTNSKEIILWYAQVFSLLLSSGSVLAAAWVIQQIFTKKSQLNARVLTLALYGFFPASVFFSSRINNDVLLELLIILFLGSILRWWNEKGDRWLYVCSISLGLAIITKSNALLLLPILILSIILRSKSSLREKCSYGAIALVIIGGLSTWHASIRHAEGQTNIVGNLSGLTSDLKIETNFQNLIQFNPIRLISQPYNNPWEDASGRQYFFEYLFRSAFTGEFSFGDSLVPIVSSMILFGLILLLTTIVGFWNIIRTYTMRYLPLWTIPVAVLLGHTLFRQFVAPYSCSQDFRYSIGALLPLAIITVFGIERLPSMLRRSLHIVGWSFVALCTIFLSSVHIA